MFAQQISVKIMGENESQFALFIRQTGVGHQSVTSIWIARAVGVTVACLTSGPAFGSSWMNGTSRKRILFLAISHFMMAGCFYSLPMVSDLSYLIFRQLKII